MGPRLAGPTSSRLRPFVRQVLLLRSSEWEALAAGIPSPVRASRALLSTSAYLGAPGGLRTSLQSLNLPSHLLDQRTQVFIGQMPGHF